MKTNKKIGNYGEYLATKYLCDKGYEIISRNWTHALGELDIIAKNKYEFVIVEVKTRTNDRAGYPGEAVTKTKLEKLSNLALAWMNESHTLTTKLAINKVKKLRFDVIEVFILPTGARINHIQDIWLDD